jgi:hypothetical protein
MNQNEANLYNQAITLAKMGHREQAYFSLKNIALNHPDDQNLIFWLMYTAPSLEKSQELLDRAHFINPENPVLREANQWLTNEKLGLPQPAEGYTLFPPAHLQAQVVPGYPAPMPEPGYPALPLAPLYPQPYQHIPGSHPYQTQAYPALPGYQPYPDQNSGHTYPPPFFSPQANLQPPPYGHYKLPAWQPYQNQGYPPVRWNGLPNYGSYLERAGNYRCPHCNSTYPPLRNRRITTSGWITFGVLVLLFFPLSWIGLLMQENYLRCSQCRLTLS